MVDTHSGAMRDGQPEDQRSTGTAVPAHVQEEVPDLTRPLQQQIQQRDDRILYLKEQLTEVMRQVASLQSRGTAAPVDTLMVLDDSHIRQMSEPSLEVAVAPVQESDIRLLVQQQVKDALAHAHGDTSIPKGRPYPAEFDDVTYPPGFMPPSFRMFDGVGNPKQHLAHFKASCCNTSGSEALLFRQFVNSLMGIAFDWYADIPSGSVRTFREMEDLFLKRFSGLEHHVSVGDLVVERQWPNESLVDYITRWRNLSAKCEPQLQEEHAVEILLKNIHGPIAFLLKGFTIRTFQKLLKKAQGLSEDPSQLTLLSGASTSDSRRHPLPHTKRPADKGEACISAVKRGKPSRQLQSRPPRPQQPYQPQQRHQPSARYTSSQSRTGFRRRVSRPFPFTREFVPRIFRTLLKSPDFQLLKPTKPDEVGRDSNPLYCPYHQMLGHVLEDCFTFKEWLEREYKKGSITIPKEYLAGPLHKPQG